LLVQLPRIAPDVFVSIYGWSHSQQEFYEKFNSGRDAEIMLLVDELEKEQSSEWIASSDRASILMGFGGRNVHSLRKKPFDIIGSEQWEQHPPEIILLKRPRPKDAPRMEAHQQLMDLFSEDKENWALDKETKSWYVFRRKTNPVKPAK